MTNEEFYKMLGVKEFIELKNKNEQEMFDVRLWPDMVDKLKKIIELTPSKGEWWMQDIHDIRLQIDAALDYYIEFLEKEKKVR